MHLTSLLLLPLALAAPSTDVTKRTVGVWKSTLYPNYLNIVKQETPDAKVCTGYTGQVNWSGPGTTNEIRLFVGFDVPAGAGNTCFIKFELPKKVPYAYEWTVLGPGKIDVWSLKNPFVNCQVSWNNRPEKVPGPAFQITQPSGPNGGKATVTGAGIPCKKGQRQDFELTIRADNLPGFFDWYELNDPVAGITLQTWNY
ncbi:hypothetical protein EX30DRAFT_337521 [Ascodesmis nigricans]|uniref:Ubiquitin 3 binding protein But2 C-terminal domain-containing protein n=1 Tax=Ascodesmis nigricans TaxID=341454 RepID=A0A4S2N7J3_9PEZI|nr:hypothetical protein EX30DRAFT_337521 [Ascodesmis nigricans]